MPHSSVQVLIAAMLIGCFSLPDQGACGQQAPTGVPRVATRTSPDPASDTGLKRVENSAGLKNALTRLERKSPAFSKSSTVAISQEIDLRKQIDSVLARKQTAESKRNDLQQEVASLKAELESLSNTAQSDRISFVEHDQIKQSLESLQSRVKSAADAVSAMSEALENSRTEKVKKEATLRIAKEALESNQEEAKKEALESAANTAELEVRYATELVLLNTINLEIEELNKEVAELTVELNERKLADWEGKIEFTEEDLQEILVQVERQELELKRRSQLAEAKLQVANSEWTSAQATLDLTEESQVAKSRLAAYRSARQLRQLELDVINLNLARLSSTRQIWEQRRAVFNRTASNEELTAWAAQTKKAVLILERERKVQQLNSNDVRSEIATLDSRLNTLSQQTMELRPLILTQIENLRSSLLAHDENLASIEGTLRLQNSLLTEIEGDMSTWTLGERFNGLLTQIKAIWFIELAILDDRPITVGKVVIGILLLFVGFFAARILSRILGNRLLVRFGLNEGAVAALKSIIFYSLIVIFSLLALRFASVPLTVFTLAGGALAIGVGFGSQAIISNFISGLIILAERPMQVGDLVKLDDLIGNVIHIGARSTRVRTGDNLDIVVPNSKFLENNVLNYTLGDDKFRSAINVGIAYGSATRDATKLLIRAAEEHGQVLENPSPFVWFSDFGDNALAFELHVWIKSRTMGERKRIESDLRYRIDHLFREGGITIAFPQRDIHLDAAQPLPIRLVENSDSAANDVD